MRCAASSRFPENFRNYNTCRLAELKCLMATAGENGRESEQFPDERKVNVAPWGRKKRDERRTKQEFRLKFRNVRRGCEHEGMNGCSRCIVLYTTTLSASTLRNVIRPDDIILRCALPDIYEQGVLLVLSRSKDRLARSRTCVCERHVVIVTFYLLKITCD